MDQRSDSPSTTVFTLPDPRVARPLDKAPRVGVKARFFRSLLRGLTWAHGRLGAFLGRLIPRRRRPTGRPLTVLLTGTFYSDFWIQSYAVPLARAPGCAKLTLVTTYPIPSEWPIEAVHPLPWLQRLIGQVPSRLMTFAWVAMRRRPDVVGGFHLLVNGLVAHFMARLIGARSLYLCVGGPMEVLDGGFWAENRLFSKIGAPDPVLERRLIQAAGAFDDVVTMGRQAGAFFETRHVTTRIHAISAGVDLATFQPGAEAPDFDVILVGRLAPIKRIDVFLEALAQASKALPGLTAAIVGEGELRATLEDQARRLGLAGRVHFAGHQHDTHLWYRRARVFALTSDSEGLAISLLEALASGLPAVVSDVGELGDAVREGINGFLVPRRAPGAFAARLVEILNDPALHARLSQAARHAAGAYSFDEITKKWNNVLMK